MFCNCVYITIKIITALYPQLYVSTLGLLLYIVQVKQPNHKGRNFPKIQNKMSFLKSHTRSPIKAYMRMIHKNLSDAHFIAEIPLIFQSLNKFPFNCLLGH